MEVDRKGKRKSKPSTMKKSHNADLFDIDGPVADIQLGKSISLTVSGIN